MSRFVREKTAAGRIDLHSANNPDRHSVGDRVYLCLCCGRTWREHGTDRPVAPTAVRQ